MVPLFIFTVAIAILSLSERSLANNSNQADVSETVSTAYSIQLLNLSNLKHFCAELHLNMNHILRIKISRLIPSTLIDVERYVE